MKNITKKLIIWAIVVLCVLAIPLVLTFTGSGVDGDGWHWTLSDFIFMSILLYGSALTYELVARKMESTVHRFAVGLSVVTALILVWGNAAVGLIGDENPANLIYPGIVFIGLISAFIIRFKPKNLSFILFAMALVQMLVPVVALIFWPPSMISWAPGVLQVFSLNAVFALLWIGSAIIFRREARQ
jgi:hypothetical protein